MWGALIPAAASLVGGLISANASKSAGDTQAAATEGATAAQERIFQKQTELQTPFRQTGLAANNRLAMLLGLSQVETPEQARARLLNQFQTTQTTSTPKPSNFQLLKNSLDPLNIFGGASSNIQANVTDPLNLFGSYNKGDVTTTSMDEASLQKAIADAIASERSDVSNPEFGSLMRDFSMSDFQADPGYAFRQAEGLRGIENSAAARGGLLSGGALKGIQKYGQDLASQEYGNAYNRFNANRTNRYNMLAGLVNTGQGATNQLTNAAGNLGAQIGSNITSGGAAQAAGQVGAANAWTNAIGQGINQYQQNQLMDLIRRPQTSQPMTSYW